jgi:imidazolonepropionase
MRDGVLLAPAMVTASRPAPCRGEQLLAVEPIRDVALAWRDGLIIYAGPAEAVPEGSFDGVPVERTAGAVLPGFVDCHTHLPFFGWRADEFGARLAGRSYRDLHGEGGIFRSARLLAEAADEEVIEFCLPLVHEMLTHGTTAFELKTGYGLSVEAELRQARLGRRLAALIPQSTSVTLLACHAVPAGMRRDDWVDQACHELIPEAARLGLADAVDVYVEDIAFSLDDLARVAEAARASGLPLRCHADQLGPSGAAETAAALGARSADHLNHVSADGIAALGSAPGTAAVLLPVSTLFLRAEPPPARQLLDSGAAVALATDFNPGTSPCLSVPEAISVAASLYRMPAASAVGAATLNAAWVLGLDGSLGSREAGKRADFVVLDSDDVSMVPYRPGHNPIAETWIAGERVFVRA